MWFWVRLAVLIVVFCLSLFPDPGVMPLSACCQDAAGLMLFCGLLFVVAIVFSMLFFVFGSITKPRSVRFIVPSLSARPFRRDNPLQFSYFAGLFFVAGGLGAIGFELGRSGDIRNQVVVLSFGLGLLLGCRLCRVIFSRAFETKEDPSRS